MDYFEEARLKAFNFIKSFESVKKLTADQLIYYKFERFVEVWKVKLDFYNNENNILEYEINDEETGEKLSSQIIIDLKKI